MDNTLFGIPLVLLGFLCVGVAVVYYFIWPRPNPQDPPRRGWQRFVLRWGHSLVWLLLGLACFTAGLDMAALAGALGVGALILYITFIVTIFLDRQAAANAALAKKRAEEQ